jgi:hypothetical protein
MQSGDLVRKNYFPWLALARLDGLGFSLRDLARHSGLTVRQVRTALAHPAFCEFRDAKLQMRVSAMDRIFADDTEKMAAGLRELVPLAIATLEESLSSTDESVRLRAAQEILDRDERFNKAAVQVVEHRIPQAEIERARELARQLKPHMMRETGEVIETQITCLGAS